MGFRWRKSLRIFPGFRLNLSHRGVRGQIGGSPLSFSFRLFGGSAARRVTASLPGTGLSFVSTSYPDPVAPEPAQPDHTPPSAPINLHSLLREALTQAGQIRFVPIRFEALSHQPAETQREVFKAAIPRFNALLIERGIQRTRPPSGPDAIDELSDEKLAGLLIEIAAKTSEANT